MVKGDFGPVGENERVEELDVLRGLALFGVLAMNFAWVGGAPLGLGLAGRIGVFAIFLISIAFFASQVAFSHWWLARYRFGPMEWLWRWLTYGKRPPFQRTAIAAVQAA